MEGEGCANTALSDAPGFAAGLRSSSVRLCLAFIALAVALGGCGGSGGDGALPGTTATGQARPGIGESAREVAAAAQDLGIKSFVYVSSQGADDDGCGQTSKAACKTIQKGIQRCAASGCAVLARHGLYPTSATIELRDAVDVYGGCRFDGEPDRKYRTTIQASPEPGTPAISATAINAPTTIHGLVVMGKNETANGAASIAMSISESKGLALTNSVLIAGKGGDGAASTPSLGAAGGNGSAPTCDTCRGAAGAACPSSPPTTGVGSGGAGAAQNALFTSGCFLDCNCSTSNGAESVGIAGQDSGSAKGGAGSGPGSSGCMCADRPATFGTVDPSAGAPGQPGASGQCGTQGGFHSVLIWGQPDSQGTDWRASTGGAGATASVGAGGGGGGSGGYATNGAGVDLSGYPGGGGGGGGCGGPGGQGGQQGGASVALALSNANVPGAAVQNGIVSGVGGNGGQGAAGGTGGPGGAGGGGSMFDQTPFLVVARCAVSAAPGRGGAGGTGGQGGAGSGGAGGNGGPSVGILVRGSSPAPPSATGVYLGTPGAGGAPGNGGVNPHCTGAAGLTGAQGGRAAVFQFDQPLASMLPPGVQLSKGQTLFSPNSQAFLSMQVDDNLCLYAPAGNPRWCANTVGQGIAQAVMQTDGDFCIRATNGPVWCSGTSGHPNASLIVQNSGTLQIVDNGVVLWSKP